MSEKKKVTIIIIITIILNLLSALAIYRLYFDKYNGLPFSYQEKRELKEIFEKYPDLSMDYVAYYEEDVYCFHCSYNDEYRSHINEKIYDEGIALYNDIIKWASRNNNILVGEKVEIEVRNGSLDHLLILSNCPPRINTVNGVNKIYDRCYYAFLCKGSHNYFSEIKDFKKKYLDVLNS